MPAYTNAVQTIPAVFKAVIENHNKQRELKSLDVIPFSPMAELLMDMRNLRHSAEKALRWNTNKGSAQ